MNATTGRIDQAVVAAQPASAGPTGLAVLVAVLLGGFILLGVGFANSATLHNAAHDARHPSPSPSPATEAAILRRESEQAVSPFGDLSFGSAAARR